jgi:hypothetical protein
MIQPDFQNRHCCEDGLGLLRRRHDPRLRPHRSPCAGAVSFLDFAEMEQRVPYFIEGFHDPIASEISHETKMECAGISRLQGMGAAFRPSHLVDADCRCRTSRRGNRTRRNDQIKPASSGRYRPPSRSPHLQIESENRSCLRATGKVCEKWTLTLSTHKFPVPAKKFPVLQNVFPVNLRRELCKNSLQRSGFWLRNRLSDPQKRKIPCKIPC